MVRPIILSHSGKHYPGENLFNPSGGIRSYLAVRLGLANAFVCPFLYVQCWHSGRLLQKSPLLEEMPDRAEESICFP